MRSSDGPAMAYVDPHYPSAMPLPQPSPLNQHWQIDPDVVYLNHGSFGATPKKVLAAQDRYRARIEAEGVRWFSLEQDGALDATRTALGAFINADAADLVFLPNVTNAVATILSNYQFKEGDEVLADTHEYQACMNNLRRWTGKAHVKINTAVMPPFPIASPDEVVEAIVKTITPRTRLALISHVTSPSGLLMPIEAILKELGSRNIDVIVDGAHGAGFVPLDMKKLESLGMTYYTSNCHKWLCSPKGSAFLWVKRDRHKGFRPLALSNSAESGKGTRSFLHTEFDYVGTSDTTAYLSIEDAIKVMGAMLPGGWPEVFSANRALALKGRDLVAKRLGTAHAAPDSMLGNLAAILLPANPPDLAAKIAARWAKEGDPLGGFLNSRHKIQIPLMHSSHPQTANQRWVRISAQLYNSIEQYEYLAQALVEELGRERDCC